MVPNPPIGPIGHPSPKYPAATQLEIVCQHSSAYTLSMEVLTGSSSAWKSSHLPEQAEIGLRADSSYAVVRQLSGTVTK